MFYSAKIVSKPNVAYIIWYKNTEKEKPRVKCVKMKIY